MSLYDDESFNKRVKHVELSRQQANLIFYEVDSEFSIYDYPKLRYVSPRMSHEDLYHMVFEVIVERNFVDYDDYYLFHFAIKLHPQKYDTVFETENTMLYNIHHPRDDGHYDFYYENKGLSYAYDGRKGK